MIDYQNITDNEIKRIVACAADPAAQVLILRDLTGKTVPDIKRAAGMLLTEEDKASEECLNKWRGWSKSDIQYLKDNKEKSLREQAAKLGRSVAGIYNMRRNLGIVTQAKWDKKTTDKLIRLYKKGVTRHEIAKKLGKTYGSVAGKIGYLKEQNKL